MGDAFIEAIHEGNSLLIETHSEHLLLRLLRRIRQKQTEDAVAARFHLLEAEALAVLYFNPMMDDRTEVVHLRVADSGEFLDPWPRGFFNERDTDLFDE